MSCCHDLTDKGLKVTLVAIVSNVLLAAGKILTGIMGNSYALIADGIESCTDIISSSVVLIGLKVSKIPPDKKHPYGHGKAESIAGLFVAACLLGAAAIIIYSSIGEIRIPHQTPSWYTLIVLLIVIVTKELLYRFIFSTGKHIESTAVKNDAWHHRSDAITSLAAFIGISIALIGGEKFASADDWAALLACFIIIFNGIKLMKDAINDLMDASASDELIQFVTTETSSTSGVISVHGLKIRKSGLGYLADIHIVVDGSISVREGHCIAHQVKDTLLKDHSKILDVLVHVEPNDDKCCSL
ncbi:MAG: cobalt-zinc-cadmium resistance protein [Verrucomicrobia bacterium GWC2_42_7]|nr:MAG: cobalt-zinc-cadmium resistance protein [Verrucomicrobia bacterium GWC2_42_7]